MRRICLIPVLLLGAAPAMAQDVREQVIGALRDHGCRLTEAQGLAVFPELGLRPEEVAIATQGMVAASEATLSADGTVLTLVPEVCDAAYGESAPAWVEERLAAAPGCRTERTALSEAAVGAGLPDGELARVIENLAGRERIVVEGQEIRLSPLLCAAAAAPEDQELALVAALEPEALDAVLERHARDRQCRVRMAEPERTARELSATATGMLRLDPEMSPQAARGLDGRFAALLADPGPGYRIEGDSGDLLLRDCTP